MKYKFLTALLLIASAFFCSCDGQESSSDNIPDNLLDVDLQIQQQTEDGWMYVNNEGAITIIAYVGTSTALEVPSTIDGVSVTKINSYAFSQNDTVTSLVVPDSVIEIGASAFQNCTSLSSVTLGSGLTTIGSAAFSGCSALTTLTIPDSVTIIGDSAFQVCTSLSSVTLGSGLTTIGASAFNQCPITSLTIPDSVVEIADSAFKNCSALNSVVLGNGLTTIGASAFSSCSNLGSLEIGSSVATIGSKAFYGCNSLLLIKIAATTPPVLSDVNTFEITTGTNFTTALQNGTLSFHFYVPAASLASYQSASVWSNYSLYLDSLGDGGEVGVTEDNIMWKQDNGEVTIVDYSGSDTSLVIPSAINNYPVKTIAAKAFENAVFSSVTIPDSVTTIGDYAFSGCDKVTALVIPDSVTTIGNYAFFDLSSLVSLTMGSGLTSIGTNAFGLASYNESTLISVIITAVTPPALGNDSVFYINSSLPLTIYVPADSETAYEAATNWSTYSTYIEAISSNSGAGITDNGLVWNCINGSVTILKYNGDGGAVDIPSSINDCPVTAIADSVFSGNIKITSIAIPDSVTSLGTYAFSGCSNMTSVTLGSGIVEISDYAFQNCSKLASIIIPDSVTSLGNYAFYKCISLSSLTFGSGLLKIGDYAFNQCSGLTSVAIPDSVTTIGDRVFYSCNSLTTLSIGSGIKSIGDYLGYYNLSTLNVTAATPPIISSLTLSNGSPSIKVPVFSLEAYKAATYWSNKSSYITALYDETGTDGYYTWYTYGSKLGLTSYSGSETAITIPSTINGINVEIIGSKLFASNTTMTSVTIPDTVTTISSQAFSSCANLTSVTIGTGVKTIESSAFNSCNKVTSITIPGNVTEISSYAFANMSALTSCTLSNGIVTLGNHAFASCYKLTEVTVPDSVTTIGSRAFYGCNSVTAIIIGSGVTQIGTQAFYKSTTSPYTLKVTATVPPTLLGSLFSAYQPSSISVPSGSVSAYQTAENWSSYSSKITGY